MLAAIPENTQDEHEGSNYRNSIVSSVEDEV